MSNLKIVKYPDARLRELSRELATADIKGQEFVKLLQDMSDTMLASDGLGLAAPQIGLNIRLFIANTKDGVIACVNPLITKHSLTKVWDEEGCLSIPEVFGQVKRWKTVRCRFIDQTGQAREIETSGLLARVIQHEIDHLDGRLFIDLAKSLTRPDLLEGYEQN